MEKDFSNGISEGILLRTVTACAFQETMVPGSRSVSMQAALDPTWDGGRPAEVRQQPTETVCVHLNNAEVLAARQAEALPSGPPGKEVTGYQR